MIQKATEKLGLTPIGIAKCSVLSDKAIEHALSKGPCNNFKKFFDMGLDYSKKNNLLLTWTNYYSYVNSQEVVDPNPIFMVPPKFVKTVVDSQSIIDSQQRETQYRESREEIFKQRQAIAKARYTARRETDPEFAAQVKELAAELPLEIRQEMAKIDPFFEELSQPLPMDTASVELRETRQAISDMKHIQDMLKGVTISESTHISNRINNALPKQPIIQPVSSFDDGPPLVPDYPFESENEYTLVIR